MKKIFLLAGEISGDTHGSGLMRALHTADPTVTFSGYGGPLMKEQGGDGILDWVADAGVVGLWEVLKMYSWFKAKMDHAIALVLQEQPDAVVLIDYPGFNLRLAKALREAGYTRPLIYYISPQVWAWKKGRIKTMAKLLDLMICIFPFEKDLYEKSGLRTVFAGHPMVDRVQTLRQGITREPDLVGLFPGSRSNEIKRLFPTMIQAAQHIRAQVPGTRFVVSAANEKLAQAMRQIALQSPLPEAQHWIQVGTVYDLMQRVQVGVVASGTATLEAACFGLPYILVYKVSPLTYLVAKAVVRIQYLGMVNVLASAPVVKELIQHDCAPNRIASEITSLLLDDSQRAKLVANLAEVTSQLGEGGAYQRAAAAVLAQLTR